MNELPTNGLTPGQEKMKKAWEGVTVYIGMNTTLTFDLSKKVFIRGVKENNVPGDPEVTTITEYNLVVFVTTKFDDLDNVSKTSLERYNVFDNDSLQGFLDTSFRKGNIKKVVDSLNRRPINTLKELLASKSPSIYIDLGDGFPVSIPCVLEPTAGFNVFAVNDTSVSLSLPVDRVENK